MHRAFEHVDDASTYGKARPLTTVLRSENVDGNLANAYCGTEMSGHCGLRVYDTTMGHGLPQEHAHSVSAVFSNS